MLHSGSRGPGNRIGTVYIELAKNDMMKLDKRVKVHECQNFLFFFVFIVVCIGLWLWLLLAAVWPFDCKVKGTF